MISEFADFRSHSTEVGPRTEETKESSSCIHPSVETTAEEVINPYVEEMHVSNTVSQPSTTSTTSPINGLSSSGASGVEKIDQVMKASNHPNNTSSSSRS